MPAFIWIVIGVIVLAALFGRQKDGGTPPAAGKSAAVRVDHPHYIDADEYECSACGARFSRRSMVCPRCGARFGGTREDSTAFEEEMLEIEDWEEEEEG
ncbi:MAG: hypothetical protein IJQ88_05435 [Clostridia bacterium]|nr:hypothetical protein [Clostridia bacterium]MBQ6721593.1 hypothetical protein [Clostridia bacterium]